VAPRALDATPRGSCSSRSCGVRGRRRARPSWLVVWCRRQVVCTLCLKIRLLQAYSPLAAPLGSDPRASHCFVHKYYVTCRLSACLDLDHKWRRRRRYASSTYGSRPCLRGRRVW